MVVKQHVPEALPKLRQWSIQLFVDLNVFDPDHFCDHADYTAPLELASGLDYCFVNGKLTVRNDCVLSEENGLLLKA